MILAKQFQRKAKMPKGPMIVVVFWISVGFLLFLLLLLLHCLDHSFFGGLPQNFKCVTMIDLLA